jgi:hypothetical protein
MTRRAILHIGGEKTGTTTLQHFMAANRDRLAARGVAYPRFCGATNHVGLAAYAMDDDRTDPLRAPFAPGGAAEAPAMRARMRDAAARELKDGRDAVFSNEHCHSRLTRPAEIARLRDFLREWFDEVRVQVYVRRQDRLAVSLYTTHLRSGGTLSEILPRTDGADLFFNHDASIRQWEDAFGPGAVRVRIFDRAELAGGSVVEDFLEQNDLGTTASYAPVRNENESMTAAAQCFLRLANPMVAEAAGGDADVMRGELGGQLSRVCPGAGAQPSREDARRFLAMYAASNEALRRRRFPLRDTLFDDRFDDYPEAADRSDFDAAEMVAVAARLHVHAMAERLRLVAEKRRLEAEVALRDARLAGLEGDWPRMERAANRADEWRPGCPEARRLIAEARSRGAEGAPARVAERAPSRTAEEARSRVAGA